MKTISLGESARRVSGSTWPSFGGATCGGGRRAVPPGLMLMVVLYKMHSGQLHPCHWATDCRLFDPVKWLAMGFEPYPSYFYTFRKRLGAHLRPWNQQVLDWALAEGWTKGDE